MKPGQIYRLADSGIGFHHRILINGLNLSVMRGELTGVIGKNGAGKSTLLRSLSGLHPFLSGNCFLDDKPLNSYSSPDLARKVSFVSSSFEPNDSMTVGELVSLGRFPYTNWIGRLLDKDHQAVYNALEMTGLQNLQNRKLLEISDGERQKAMIARTLAQDTPVIILDEPTAFLDLPSRYDIISLLYNLTREGKTVIYSTHDLNIACRFSDKLWLFDRDMVRQGSPEDLFLNNTLSDIFDSGIIQLNKLTGDFEIRSEFRFSISLSCPDEVTQYWTLQALHRAGFRIAEPRPGIPGLIVHVSEKGLVWDLDGKEYYSLYDLVAALPGYTIQSES